jgi:uncharacterized membrane protein
MFIKIYLIAVIVFFAVDMLWLGIIAKNFYQNQIGSLMKKDINWTAAIIFYLLFVAGVVFFAINPAIQENSWIQALFLGALFGFITYMTYDLTNLATLKNWPLKLAIVDILWGTVLATLVSTVTYSIVTKFIL